MDGSGDRRLRRGCSSWPSSCTAWDSIGGTVTYVILAVISLTLLAVTTHRLGTQRTAGAVRTVGEAV